MSEFLNAIRLSAGDRVFEIVLTILVAVAAAGGICAILTGVLVCFAPNAV